tara:strand:- start:1201 stop:2220 length:1020 start_codon:yes stop_codon:yes gene_type:complete
MKIIHIIPTLNTGGAESFLLALSTHLEKRNSKQVIYTLSNPVDHDLTHQFNSEIEIYSDEIKILDLMKGDSNISIICWMYPAILFVEKLRLINRFKNPIIWNIRHSNFTRCQVKQKAGVLMLGFFSRLMNRKIIYCAFAAKKFHEKLFFSKKTSLVIQNRLAKLILFKKSSKKASYLLYVGRYDYLKGPDRLLSICNEYFKTKDSRDLIIAGSGWDYNKIPKTIKGRVSLVGNVTNLGELYQNAFCFLFTSRSEGYPNGVIEACSFGIPVIGFSAGDSDIILKNYEYAKVVKNKSEFVLELSNLKEISTNQRKRQGEMVRKHFHFDFTVNEYIKYISSK